MTDQFFTDVSHRINALFIVFVDDPWHYENDNSLYLTFLTDSVVEESEYLVYDMVGIVSALGGGLGMFLGFSLYHVFDDIIWLTFSSGKISELVLQR